ncbi:MAG: sulfur oxidation c-type cytochrome SoxA [Pseudomonadota bacterium]|nr:sulfur oxidation c-type cytochrome SoxA [Pseudomonadota bacterium]
MKKSFRSLNDTTTPWIAAGLFCAVIVVHAAVPNEPRSGYEYLREESKEMQDDEFMNPGMQTVETGLALFNQEGQSGESCGSCHGEEGEKLDIQRIAMYPVFDEELKKPVTLQQRILMESENRLGNKPLKYNGKESLALETFVRHLAVGEKVNVKTDGPMAPYFERGETLYHVRSGQLDMGCTNCHDFYAGMKIRANTLSQGQSNGYPVYRLKNGRINAIQDRFNQCYRQFRADGLEYGSDDAVALEVYVTARGNGLPIETPGVRF